ncbi:hypothetical protein MWU58_05955 [Flavobacteriaceae bacterium S0825]|uniref:hypothetical protein n=1 Tax=Gaetbulibacter sp. S0825 TaxID=2720084 RepID=UPI00142F803E|nr:hypothetical protein [Gaetbulibacter sp. S0825]MCK0108828.1 hypothetical protein [Flavobacteriaceae bacterium S0825]NIX64464.1 hypothetical protein [Gaetbulibacter sp. S0825]
MEIEKGFKIDSPDVFVPWNISEKEFVKLFETNKLKNVANGYYTISCESLDGLKCFIGFHFDPRRNGILNELEFFRLDYTNQKASFEDFQFHFEKAFGNPNLKSKGKEGFDNYQWSINEIRIMHYIFDRFGNEEHMRIRNESTSIIKEL